MVRHDTDSIHSSAAGAAVITHSDPASDYRRQCGRLERRIARLRRLDTRFTRSRVATAVVGIAVLGVFLGTGSDPVAGRLFLLLAAAFAVLVFLHGRLLGRLERHRLYLAIKRSHLARIDRDWERIPPHTTVAVSDDHPFASDLDILGERSIHRLIDTAATVQGSRRLADWLLETDPDSTDTGRRASIVRALLPHGPFRDRLRLLGTVVTADPDTRWEGDALLSWLDGHVDSPRLRTWVLVLVPLALLNLGLFGVWFEAWLGARIGAAPTPWWLLSLIVYAVIYVSVLRHAAHLFDEAEHLYSEITRFRPVMLFLERFRFSADGPLYAQCAPFRSEPRPSAVLRRIARLAAAAGTQKSELVRFALNLLVPWDLWFALRLARCKESVRDVLPGWLEAWRTLEAASSLATYGALNPGTCFAEFVPGNDSPLLDARALGHPLLPEPPRVRNDFRLDAPGHVALITGSNMSGKSTFLRTVGVNLAIAYAGGPVTASSFVVRPLRIFTCINVIDSVNDGISHFYAEVKRLRALLAELEREHPDPVLYLVDEIFRGTNNRERLIGSRAYLRAISNRYGAGLVSTHDLELTGLEREVDGLENFHFRETIVGRRMQFDYGLHEGPCPTTNALRIMELEGLPVPRESGTTHATDDRSD